ncbi:MAG: glycosyltransferase [Candidatus Competibacteraceae bacterium]|nr:MAG: glycosyltransferase [Candidatus Competibacteraceae bacterium]
MLAIGKLAINWPSWEARLYRWYYALPLFSYAQKRRLVLWIHTYCGFLTRRSESYRYFKYRQLTADMPSFEAEPGMDNSRDYRAWFKRYVALNRRQRLALQQRFARLPARPITIVLPVAAGQGQEFQTTADSVYQQLYPHWALVILLQDPGLWPVVEHWRDKVTHDARIQALLSVPGTAVESQDLLNLIRADHVMLLESGTLLHAAALGYIAETLLDHPEAALIYSDEDRTEPRGWHYDPYFKPNWSPDLALAQNLAGGFCVVRCDGLAPFLTGGPPPSVHELSLWVSERVENSQIVHIPRVLHHRLHSDETATALVASESALRRRRIEAWIEPSPLLSGSVRVRYPLPQPAPRVSLIVPTRNGIEVLRTCIDSIVARTDYPDYELLIVDNGSDEPATLDYLASLGERYPATRIRVLRDDRPFNYSQLNNAAVEQANGALIGLLNNDLEVIEADWLTEMASHALRPDIGAVGARLLYPDGRIQHAGVIVGFGGVAGHFMRRTTPADSRDAARVLLTQNFTAVTAACMVLRRALFLEIGGFEEQHLQVQFNDVDLCLRIRERGYRNLYTPFAVFYHHESATRGPNDDTPEKLSRAAREQEFLNARWATTRFLDPFYSPNLSLYHEQSAYSFPPRLAQP